MGDLESTQTGRQAGRQAGWKAGTLRVAASQPPGFLLLLLLLWSVLAFFASVLDFRCRALPHTYGIIRTHFNAPVPFHYPHSISSRTTSPQTQT